MAKVNAAQNAAKTLREHKRRIQELENGLREFLKINQVNHGAIGALKNQIVRSNKKVEQDLRAQLTATNIKIPVITTDSNIMTEDATSHSTKLSHFQSHLQSQMSSHVASKEMELYQMSTAYNQNVNELKVAKGHITDLEQELSRLKANDAIVCQKWRETMDQNARLQSEFAEFRRQSEAEKQMLSQQNPNHFENELKMTKHEMFKKQEQWNKERITFQQRIADLERVNGEKQGNQSKGESSNSKEKRIQNQMENSNENPKGNVKGNHEKLYIEFGSNEVMDTLNGIAEIAQFHNKFGDKEHIENMYIRDLIHFDKDHNLYYTDSVEEFFRFIDPLISKLTRTSKQEDQILFAIFILEFAFTLKFRTCSNPIDFVLIIGDLSRLRQRIERSDAESRVESHGPSKVPSKGESGGCTNILLLIDKLVGDVLEKAAVFLYDSISENLKQRIIGSDVSNTDGTSLDGTSQDGTSQNGVYEQIYSKLKEFNDQIPSVAQEPMFMETNRVLLSGIANILKENPVVKSTEFAMLKQENRLLKRIVNQAKEYGFNPQKLREIKEYQKCKRLVRRRLSDYNTIHLSQ